MIVGLTISVLAGCSGGRALDTTNPTETAETGDPDTSETADSGDPTLPREKPDYPAWVTDVSTVSSRILDGPEWTHFGARIDVAHGDLTGDGLKDIVIQGRNEFQERLWVLPVLGLDRQSADSALATIIGNGENWHTHALAIGQLSGTPALDLLWNDEVKRCGEPGREPCRLGSVYEGPLSGSIDPSPDGDVPALLVPSEAQSSMHPARLAIPDRNEDGLDELLLLDYANGFVDLRFSPHGDGVAEARWTTGTHWGFGNRAAAQECNDDGIEDFLIMASGGGDDGEALILDGSFVGEQPLAGYHLTRMADAGAHVAAVGDIDNDGDACDILVGDAAWDEKAGIARIYDGTAGGNLQVSDALATFTFDWPSSTWLGIEVAGIGDFDGDGHDDIAITAKRPASGIVGIFRGPIAPGNHAFEDANIALAAEWDRDDFGASIAALGDIDGDGKHDIAIGAPSGIEPYEGRVYIVHGRELD